MAYPKLTDQPGAIATAAAIRAGEMSPLEAVEDAIARIEHLDVHINAVAVCDFERAVEAAHAMNGQAPGEDQPLFGVPMTIKESFDIAGLPTCRGYEAHADHIAQRDARVVTRLKAAGAIFIGKTNVPVGLTDWQSFNPVYGRTNNPHDHSRSPGGSSGGSAATVASGMVACDFGTDIGASLRVPAHFCGVWTHKPSWGLVSKFGHDHPALKGKDAHDGVLSVPGPYARNGEDIDLLLRLTAEFPTETRNKPLKDCRVLALLDHPVSPIDDSVRHPIEEAIEELVAAGVKIERKSDLVPDLAAQHADYLRMMNIAMAGGAPSPDGKQASAADWFGLLDQQRRNELAWARLFEDFDFVLAPPAPVLAVPHSHESVFRGTLDINGAQRPGAEGLAWAGLATFPNLPSTVLPIGETIVDEACLPCGLQVIGPFWRDFDCIAAAREIDAVVNS